MNILNRFLVISLLASGVSAELFAKQTYVFVERRDKVWVVILGGHEEFDKEIKSTFKRFEAQIRENDILNRPQFPSFLKKVQKMSILTKSGNKELSLKGTARIWEQCLVTFDFPLVGDPGIDTFAIGSLNAPFPRNAYLRDLKISSGKDHGAVADKIWKGILATADKDLLKILKAKENKMDASLLQFAKTKLSDKDAWIVWLYEDMREEVEPVPIDFSFIVDAKGNILHKLNNVNTYDQRWVPLFVTDLNGDGKEEIIGQSFYHKGSSIEILEFKDKGYTTTTLTSGGC